jgi:hypothetical protein
MIIWKINFVWASGVIIPNSIIQKRTQNWIQIFQIFHIFQIFQIFLVTIFMILLDDSMSVFMWIIYDSNELSRCSESPGSNSRLWCLFLWLLWFLWFHDLFSKNSISFVSLSVMMFWNRWKWWVRLRGFPHMTRTQMSSFRF